MHTINHMLPVETEHIRLRRLESGDAADLAQYRADPGVARYQSWNSMTLDEARDFISAQSTALFSTVGEWYQLAIADKLTDALIGDIGVCIRSPRERAEIGFTVAPSAQSRGLATEACSAAVEFIFRASGVTTIEAIVDSRNTPAIALVKRLGMWFCHAETAEFKGESCSEYHFLLRRQREGAG